MKRLVTSFVPGISRVISNATPIIILFIFSKFVFPDELGILNYFISLITLIGVFTDFGLPEAVLRFLPQNKSPKLIFSTLVLEIWIILVGAMIVLALDMFFSFQISRGYPLLLFFIIVFSASNVIVLIYNGLQDKLRTSTYFLFSSLIFIFVTFFLYFAKLSDPISSFLIGRLVSWVIFTIIPLFDLYFRKLITFSFDLPRRYLKFSFNNFIVAFSYNLFNQWDSILIINILGAFQNGVYKSVAFLASLPYVASVVLQTKLLPEYSEFYHKNEVDKIRASFNFFTKILIVGGIVLVFLSIPLSHLGISIVYNNEIADLGYQYLPLILFAVMIYIASVPATSVLLATGKEHIVRNMALIQSIGFVVLSTLFLQSLGLMILPVILIFLNLLFFLVNLLFSLKEFR